VEDHGLVSGVVMVDRPRWFGSLSLYGPGYASQPPEALVAVGHRKLITYVGPPLMTLCAKTRSMAYLTSLDVIGEPSSNFSPERSLYVQVLPPSLLVPAADARSGTTSRPPLPGSAL